MAEIGLPDIVKPDPPKIKEVTSRSLTLVNLGSRISNELRDSIAKQKNLLNLAGNASLWGVKLGPDDYKNGMRNYSKLTNDTDDTTSAMEKLLKEIDKEGLVDSDIGMAIAKENGADDDGTAEGKTTEISLMLGKCPVLNPPWQFGELDDVRSNRSYPLLGRVYLTYIYSNYPIVAFEPGREKFSLHPMDLIGLSPFGESKKLNNYIRSGGKLGGLFNTIGNGLVAIKNVLLAGLDAAFSFLGDDENRFVKFVPAMPLFMRIVNDLMRELAGNMRLLDLSGEAQVDAGIPTNERNPGDKQFLVNNIYSSGKGTESYDESKDEYVDVGGSGKEDYDTPGSLKDAKDTGKTKLSGNWFARLRASGSALLESMQYATSTYRGSVRHLNIISFLPKGDKQDFLDKNRTYLPFMCQRAITVSETFTNNTSEHPIASQLNGIAQDAEAKNSTGGLKGIMDVVGGFNGDPLTSLKEIASQFMQKIGGEVVSNVSELGMLMTGSGRALLPDIWSGSQYSRDYSIDFTFFSPSGDTVSVFENEYIQFATLLSLANPIQTGKYLYTSPFVVKVYSKGLFSVNMGMITSLTVTRGTEKNDRTIYGYPRTLKIQLSLKDLAPTFMLSLGGGNFWHFRRKNEGLTEYIAILTNLSIADRYNIARKWSLYWAKLKSEWFDVNLNPDSIGFNIARKFATMKPIAYWAHRFGGFTPDQTMNVASGS